MLSRASIVLAVVFAALMAYWRFLSRPAGLQIPRQIVLALGFGSALMGLASQ